VTSGVEVLERLEAALEHHRAGRLADAERAYRRLLADRAAAPDVPHLLGVLLLQTGRPEGAEPLIAEAVRRRPDVVDFRVSHGDALAALGRFDAAIASYEAALGLDPASTEARTGLRNAHNNRGAARLRAGDAAGAEDAFRRALAGGSEVAEIHNNLGIALARQGRLEAAVGAFARAVSLAPERAEIHRNLGLALLRQGRTPEARASYARAVALAPADAEAHSDLIFTLDLDPAATAGDAAAERHRWGARHGAPLVAAAPHANAPDPERRLRVGYVSADFRLHSAADVLAPVVLGHDREAFEVVCYSGVTEPDAVTARFRAGVDLWRETRDVPDAALAAMIRADAIDILVDLSGHSSGNRLPVFARRPAPVQATAWGHAGGTGLAAIGYAFADAVTVPPDARARFVEDIVELPAIVAYAPPAEAPAVAPLPALAAGYPTFGCFNRLCKVGDPVLALWAYVLGAVPDARVLLKDPALDEASVRERVRARFAAQGGAPDRLDFAGGTSRSEHLAAWARVDIALDPFPHGGGVSALEGLWMGVPLVTLRGDAIAGRLGASFLAALGLTDWVAASPATYVAHAARGARDVDALAALRADLRRRLAASALGDHSAYGRAVEAAYRRMWRRYCEARTGAGR
jgi:predicted O-linked N-acetylglucosamine transferase (SPINDLY family)